MSVYSDVERPLRVVYRGVEGAYGQLAAKKFFADREDRCTFTGCATFDAVVQAVESGAYAYRPTREDRLFTTSSDPLPGVNSILDVPFAAGTLAVNSTREDAFSMVFIRLRRTRIAAAARFHAKPDDATILSF